MSIIENNLLLLTYSIALLSGKYFSELLLIPKNLLDKQVDN